MSVYERIKNGWKASSEKLSDSDWFWRRTAGTLVLGRVYRETMRRYARGRLLDAGAGTLSGRQIAIHHCDQYVSIDWRKTHPELDYVGDVQHMPLADNSFDTVLSLQVLEHVPNPKAAVSEMERVLAPGGVVIMAVPFFWYLHNEPYDYWRYTKHGLKELFTSGGFEVVFVKPLGGLFSFLHHLLFTAAVSVTHFVPLLGQVILWIGYVTGYVMIELDQLVDTKRLFPLYYIGVFRKNKSRSNETI